MKCPKWYPDDQLIRINFLSTIFTLFGLLSDCLFLYLKRFGRVRSGLLQVIFKNLELTLYLVQGVDWNNL